MKRELRGAVCSAATLPFLILLSLSLRKTKYYLIGERDCTVNIIESVKGVKNLKTNFGGFSPFLFRRKLELPALQLEVGFQVGKARSLFSFKLAPFIPPASSLLVNLAYTLLFRFSFCTQPL